MPIYRPYGTWESPITARRLTEGSVGVTPVGTFDGRLCWLESRSTEKGRVVLVADGAGGAATELTPPGHSVRSRVHEYGGGAAACDGSRLAYVNFADQRVYSVGPDRAPVALTEASGDRDPTVRYADMSFHPSSGHIACVREDHRDGGEQANAIVRLDPSAPSCHGTAVAEGKDFYASPRFSPDGRWLSYLSWDHPNMPWDGTDLWRLAWDTPGAEPEHVAGGTEESVFQPEWSPQGVLHFISDRTGWWNLYRVGRQGIEPVFPIEADCGLPLWQFGARSYALLPDGTPLVAVIEQGISRLYRVADGEGERIDLQGWDVASSPIATSEGVLLACGSFSRPSAIVAVETEALAAPAAAVQGRVLRASAQLDIDAGYLATVKPVSYPTADGAEAHGFHYPPANPRFAGTAGTLPPLIVRSHGGPTAATSPELSLAIQYWTSRGFAVLDVNYRGSTGYGRAYRDALKGQWGVADVEDCRAGADYLAAQGLVDPDRLVIRGGSAGGYTTLCALAFTDQFKAGASHYGVGDLRALARDTHKFESRYLDTLVGPLPEAEAVYEARSPLAHAERIRCPVIFLQGLEDKVVPPNQAEAMVAALQSNGVPVAYLAFEGEQHGFRQAATIVRALEAELWFYGNVFGFMPADQIEPVPILG